MLLFLGIAAQASLEASNQEGFHQHQSSARGARYIYIYICIHRHIYALLTHLHPQIRGVFFRAKSLPAWLFKEHQEAELE